MVGKFVSLYSWEFSTPFQNLTELVTDLEWKKVVSQTTSEFFDLQGIDRRWTREMVEGATRVNYGQDVDQIHALEGLCSLATTGASSVKGGNYQLFEQFVKRSNATLHLNTTVSPPSHLDVELRPVRFLCQLTSWFLGDEYLKRRKEFSLDAPHD